MVRRTVERFVVSNGCHNFVVNVWYTAVHNIHFQYESVIFIVVADIDSVGCNA